MVLSKPHTCYHSHGEDTLVMGNKREKSEKMEEMKEGWFHIKAVSVISALKNTEVEDFRRFTMDARACIDW